MHVVKVLLLLFFVAGSKCQKKEGKWKKNFEGGSKY
jgi:hypothetical protein